jgi:hypothetical protein
MALLLVLLALLLPLSAPAAEASPITLRLEAGINEGSLVELLTLADWDLGDLSAEVGRVEFAGLLGAYDFSITTGSSTPLPGELARLNLYSMNIHNSDAAGALRVTLVNSYSSVYSGSALASADALGELIAPLGSTVTIQSWINAANATPPLPPGSPAAIPAGSIPVYSGLAPIGPGPFNVADTELVNLAAQDLALFTQITINFSGFGSTSITDANIGVAPVAAVPEPTSLFLISSGVLGLVTAVRRRNKKRNGSTVA